MPQGMSELPRQPAEAGTTNNECPVTLELTNNRCLGTEALAALVASGILESPLDESTSLPLPGPVCESDARPARFRQAAVSRNQGSRCGVWS